MMLDTSVQEPDSNVVSFATHSRVMMEGMQEPSIEWDSDRLPERIA